MTARILSVENEDGIVYVTTTDGTFTLLADDLADLAIGTPTRCAGCLAEYGPTADDFGLCPACYRFHRIAERLGKPEGRHD
jgi:hypothetical protein